MLLKSGHILEWLSQQRPIFGMQDGTQYRTRLTNSSKSLKSGETNVCFTCSQSSLIQVFVFWLLSSRESYNQM